MKFGIQVQLLDSLLNISCFTIECLVPHGSQTLLLLPLAVLDARQL